LEETEREETEEVEVKKELPLAEDMLEVYELLKPRIVFWEHNEKRYKFELQEIPWIKEKEIQDKCTYVEAGGEGEKDKVIIKAGRMQVLKLKECIKASPKGFNLIGIPGVLGKWLAEQCPISIKLDKDDEKNSEEL